MAASRKYLEEIDGTEAMEAVKGEGALKFDGRWYRELSLAEEDLLIDMAQKEGFVTEADNYVRLSLIPT